MSYSYLVDKRHENLNIFYEGNIEPDKFDFKLQFMMHFTINGPDHKKKISKFEKIP